jgi:mycoredoxin
LSGWRIVPAVAHYSVFVQGWQPCWLLLSSFRRRLWYHGDWPTFSRLAEIHLVTRMMYGRIVLYGSDLCPMTPPVRNLLDRAGANYDYISISRNRAAKEKVMQINNGNASVPTLVFPDGNTLTEPKLAELTARLEEMGYSIARSTIRQEVLLTFQSPRLLNFGVIFLAIGVTMNTPSLTFAGSVLLATAVLGRLALLRSRSRA